ncbi:MAG: HD domain-containing protein [Candidatus Aenigmarchaeota archaeon]|nr:HD domain-containing protein [Candidatus Aenigmarchaeota archaeon]
MEKEEVIKILEPQVGYLAKSNGEQLWMHHFTVWNIFKEISEYIPYLKKNKNDKKLLEMACLIHDLEKRNPKYQELFKSGGGKPIKEGHKPILTEIKKYVEAYTNYSFSKEEIKEIYDIILTHHSISDKNVNEITTNSVGVKTKILKWCDHLASMENVNYNLIQEIREYLGELKLADLTYFEISRFPSPTTMLFVEEGIKVYKQNGWTPLIVLDNSCVFIGKNAKMPEKEKITNQILNRFFEETMQLYPVYHPTKNILGGLSQIFPFQFLKLERKKEEIKENLSNVDKKGNQFFRLLYDLVNLSQNKEIQNLKKQYKLLNFLSSCLYTSGHKRAKEQWNEYFNEKPSSINTEKINELLEKIRLSDISPIRYYNTNISNKFLSEIRKDELLSVLSKIAEDSEDKAKIEQLKGTIDNLITAEEEKDFREVAQEIFERYKAYKRTTNSSKGLCERCGCILAMDAKPSLMFKKGGGYGFSQIKAKPQGANATCIFCAYDNMILRKNMSADSSAIYVKIESKIPNEIKQTDEKIYRFIKNLCAGITNPSSIIKFEEKEELRALLLPKRGINPILIPIPFIEKEGELKDREIIETERGLIIKIESRVDLKDFSPKDYKVKYEPLYHVLNLLGFKVSIGTEEQIGLFGENVITTEEKYNESLAVILLASTLFYKQQNKKKWKQKRFIFAKNLLEKSPSVAFRYAGQEDKDKSGNPCLKFNKKLINSFFGFVYSSNQILFKINNCVYIMKDLLNDAIFFAEGIPKFCWTTEWSKPRTKHLITKPISQTMNEILQGNDFEVSFAKFLAQIRENIAKEKSEVKAGANTDIVELKEFVKEAKLKIKRYYDLKQANITQFIRIKNALLSAIFVFNRYPNLINDLKENNNEGDKK